MFDVGFAELLVLAVIAMVVVGPERLPGVLRTVGKTVGQARRFMTGLQNQIEQEVKLDELNKKIMAETKDLDFTKPATPTHQTEDAEVPTIAPKARDEDAAETEEPASADPEPNNPPSNEDTHDTNRS